MEQDLRMIVEALIARSKEDEVNWRSTSSDSEYSLFLDQSTITIERILSFSVPSHVLRVYNENGDLSLEIDSSQLSVEESILLQKLYDSASESFRHVNKTLKSIIGELRKPGMIGRESNSDELPF